MSSKPSFVSAYDFFNKIMCSFLIIAFAFGALLAEDEPYHFLPEALIMKEPASKARWIWDEPESKPRKEKACFRLRIPVDAPVKKADVLFYFGCSSEAFLNGEPLPLLPYPHQQKRQRAARRLDLKPGLKQGENILSFMMLHTGRLRPTGLLLFKGEIEFADGRKLELFSDESVKTAKSPAEGWQKPGFDDSQWRPAVAKGDALSYPWINVCDIPGVFMTPDEYRAYRRQMDRAVALPPSMASEKDCQVKIEWKGSAAAINVNGKTIPPIQARGFYVCNPYGDDAIAKLYRSGVRIFDFEITSDQLYDGDTYSNYGYIDDWAGRTLHLAPESWLLPTIYIMPLPEWNKAHPGELIGYGAAGAGGSQDAVYGAPAFASPASLLFRAKCGEIIRNTAKYIRSRPWSKRVIGIRVCWGTGGEFQYPGPRRAPDTGPAMQKYFRRFLTERYKTDAALQAAWHDPKATLANVSVPNFQERCHDAYLRNPDSAEKRIMDYYDCHQDALTTFAVDLCCIVKEELPGRLAGIYGGYCLSGMKTSEGYHGMLEQMMQSGAIDFVAAPCSYDIHTRRLGRANFIAMFNSVMKKYGKLFFLEDDCRLHVNKPWLALQSVMTRNPQESETKLFRNFSHMLFEGAGLLYADPENGVGERPYTMAIPVAVNAIGQFVRIWQRNWENPYANQNQTMPRTAVVFSTEECIRHGYPDYELNRLNYFLNVFSIVCLYASGHTVDLMTPRDYLETPKEYKAVVFLNPFTFTDEMRGKLAAKIRRPGTTSIWIFAPGLVTEHGFSDRAMEELCGIRLRSEFVRQPMYMTMTNGGTLGTVFGRVRNGKVVHIVHEESPRVRVADPAASALGYFKDDGSIGFASKRLPGGATSVFCAIPINREEVWQKLLAMAGSHAYVQSGSDRCIRANDRLFMLNVGKGGSYPVTFPRPVKTARDLFTGEVFTVNGTALTLNSPTPKTWLLELEY